MKKYSSIISCAVIAFVAVVFVSCNGQSTGGKVTLKNNVDSLSYIAGINEAKRNIPPAAFEQIGIQGFEQEFIKGFSEGITVKEDDKKSKAHILGLQFGLGMASQMVPQLNNYVFGKDSTKSLNVNLLKEGMIAMILNKEVPADFDDATFNILVEQVKAETFKDIIAENSKFLEENKTKEGIVTLPSGLQYKVITEGTGPKPTATDKVKVHYHGTTIDGKIFDSSVDRGEPSEFMANRVIKGWTEGLQLMPVGSKYTFYIPADLAYGANGSGQNVGPYATLIFDVELIDITTPPAPGTNAPAPPNKK